MTAQAGSAVHCAQCPSRRICWPGVESAPDLAQLDGTVQLRIKVKRGQALLHHGQGFRNVYAVRSGFFKTYALSGDGREQVTGFQMPGEWVGLDGTVNGQHVANCMALEDSEACVLPFAQLEIALLGLAPMRHPLHRMLSQEIVRKGDVLLLLGVIRAEERVAGLLLDLVQRQQARGYSASELMLKMSRLDLANYLCIKHETLSRTFAKLVERGVLEVDKQQVRLLDLPALRGIASAQSPAPAVDLAGQRPGSSTRVPIKLQSRAGKALMPA